MCSGWRQARELAVRVVSLYRTVALTDEDRRAAMLAELHRGPDLTPELSSSPPEVDLPEMPTPEQRLLRINMSLIPVGGAADCAGASWWFTAATSGTRSVIGMRLPDGEWLNVRAQLEPLRPWHSPTFLVAFTLMTAAAALLTLWAVRRLTAPVRTLAEAAEALGRDVNAPPLPENGPDRGGRRGGGVQHHGGADPALRATTGRSC